MKVEWLNTVITRINLAMCVPPKTGKIMHKNRPFHGLVFNSSGCERDYVFSDGVVLHTKENTLFYLPRGSSYEVRSISEGYCYAINFEADIRDEPFVTCLKNPEIIKKLFKRASDEWNRFGMKQSAFAMSAVYEALCLLHKESERGYMPENKYGLISPAVDCIESDCLNSDITVKNLAELCGISEVYMRKIFMNRFGISPKEYLIRKRMDYACRLLSSRQFEVNEVAQMCGYPEPCHFSREFKKRMGVAPKDYT